MLRVSRLSLVLTLSAAPILAGEPNPADAPVDWPEAILAGSLSGTDPVFRRPAIGAVGECFLDPLATAVRYDVHEITLPGQPDATPGHLRASLCDGGTAAFNAVIAVYAATDRQAGAFNPANPCQNLIRLSDDACGQQPLVDVESSIFDGVIEVVVTSDANGATGAYSIELLSLTSDLGQFTFRESTERGDMGQWGEVGE